MAVLGAGFDVLKEGDIYTVRETRRRRHTERRERHTQKQRERHTYTSIFHRRMTRQLGEGYFCAFAFACLCVHLRVHVRCLCMSLCVAVCLFASVSFICSAFLISSHGTTAFSVSLSLSCMFLLFLSIPASPPSLTHTHTTSLLSSRQFIKKLPSVWTRQGLSTRVDLTVFE